MKFDMHCHTKEGSLDAKAKLASIALNLKEKGFSGMLVTDHNSYKGYQHFLRWKKELKKEIKDFVILKGIEYDTRDGGHMLVVLPDYVECRLLELRGMTVDKLVHLVHELGGIIGPAHPYGTGFFALMNNLRFKRNKDILHKFDFIETYNSTNHPKANKRAVELAQKYNKLGFAGSDAHHMKNLGTAFTEFKERITCNNDLIKAVKNNTRTHEGLHQELIKQKEMNGLIIWLGIIGYWIYNKAGALVYTLARIIEHRRHKRTLLCRDKNEKNT